MEKAIKVKEEYYIEFTDEELAKLNLKKGDKLTVEIDEKTKDIKLVPYGTIDIDLKEFSRENLEFIITESIERDLSVNEVFTDILTKAVKAYKDEK